MKKPSDIAGRAQPLAEDIERGEVATVDAIAADAASRTGERRNAPRGIVMMITGVLFFSLSDALGKDLLSALPAIEVAALRFGVIVLLVVGWSLARSGGLRFGSKRPWLQILRGTLVCCSGAAFIQGLERLPLAESSAINYISPVLIMLMAALLLKERIGPHRIVGCIAGTVGVLVIVRPGTAAFDPFAIFPLIAAFSWAAASIATRPLGKVDGTESLVFWSSIVGFLLCGLGALPAFVVPDIGRAPHILMLGITSGTAHVLVALAYRDAEASVVAPFTYTQILWAASIGFAAFGAVPTLFTWIGGALIAGGGIYVVYRERRTPTGIDEVEEA